ncbi:hypothetical protein AB4K20DRAFT_1923005 [Rhizopus microsporus]
MINNRVLTFQIAFGWMKVYIQIIVYNAYCILQIAQTNLFFFSCTLCICVYTYCFQKIIYRYTIRYTVTFSKKKNM